MRSTLVLALLALANPALAGKKKRAETPAVEPSPVPAPVAAPASAAPQTDTAIAYNDGIVHEQLAIGEQIAALLVAMDGEDSARTAAAHAELDARVTAAITKVSAMPALDGNTDLRDTAVALFTFYQRTVRGPYARLIAILADGQTTEAEYAEAQQLLAGIPTDEAVFDQAFSTAQESFAARWGITLE